MPQYQQTLNSVKIILMKHPANAMLLLVILLGHACTSYKTERILETDSLNDSIKAATSKGEAWSKSPESISRHLFPAEAHAEGNRNYSIQVDGRSRTTCDVTIVDEGAMDDEVYGQEWKTTFKKTGDCWQLTKLIKSLKRRS